MSSWRETENYIIYLDSIDPARFSASPLRRLSCKSSSPFVIHPISVVRIIDRVVRKGHLLDWERAFGEQINCNSVQCHHDVEDDLVPMKRLVIYHDNALELLHGLLHSRRGCTGLIICATRREFLKQLASSLSAHQHVQQAAPEDDVQGDEDSERVQPHPLLVPTLQLLSDSKDIKLAFCPTINTLRAHLSTFAAPENDDPDSRKLLLIIDLILIHHATSEFSVQGLMRSLASAVEAAARNHMDLQMCECKDIRDLQNPDRGPRLWDAQVPLLSGSVKLRGEDAGWSRRVVSVRTVAGRWFEFEKKEQARDEEVVEDEEMLV
jgi:hypothetical protein